ncbi:hypothetical protein F8M41_020481 [Gigaspora margarita]|uniref:Uncharacterized protein n=1 Tax=Gigaspora margarita TaxID=4874 RepID=A0A8H4EJN8_GIGMA|nr:hypothetical protein F8M41_020481 [Gigaspora margarita]
MGYQEKILSLELFDAQIELKEERRKWQEEYEQYRADIEDMKRRIEEIEAAALHSVLCLQGVIEEKKRYYSKYYGSL